MRQRHRELLNSDVEDTLEFLREHVLAIARDLRAKRHPQDLVGMDALADTARKLVKRVREKDDILGVTRGTRIVRHAAGIVWGIDNSARYPDLEETISWLDRVVENIEYELDWIDRKRVMWLTLFAAILSALAVLVAVIAVLVSVWIRS